jgi:hypothetical protein
MVRRCYRPSHVLSVLYKTDRARHQTGAFLRILLARQDHKIAALVAQEGTPPSLASRLVSASAIWWDQLSRRALTLTRLALFVPSTWGDSIVHTIAGLDLPLECFRYGSPSIKVDRIYPSESNSSHLDVPYVIYPYHSNVPPLLLEVKKRLPELDLSFRCGQWELSLLGFPVVWTDREGAVHFDRSDAKDFVPNRLSRVLSHISEVRYFRSYPAPDPGHPFYQYGEEKWLESLVVRRLDLIEPQLVGPVYCQVPTWMGPERRILDLLAVTSTGQLAVLELKSQKSIELVFQGFDYWRRVNYHLRNGDFKQAGYFSNTEILNREAVLYLVCPLFEFHKLLGIFRRYLDSQIKIECRGINSDWKRRLKVLRRFQL